MGGRTALTQLKAPVVLVANIMFQVSWVSVSKLLCGIFVPVA